MEQNRLKSKVKTYLTVCLLAVVTMTAPAWGQSIEELTINYIETVTTDDKSANQVRVYASVTAADDNPVLGLSAADFEVLQDGREVDVEHVSPATDPMAIVLAIDTSGSMQAQDRSGRTSMAAAKGAAMKFISMLSIGDQVALYSFNNEPILKIDFSNDHEATIKAVHLLDAKPNAATCLYDTAFEAVKKAAEIPRGRRAIILLTDGKDEKAGRACSMHTANDVIDVATTKSIRVPIFTIGVGPKVDARELGRIASFTGGRNLLATSLSDLQGFYQALANQLKNQYLITYITHSPSGEHTLVLKVQRAGARRQDEKRFWSPPPPLSRPLSISFIKPGTVEHVKGVVTVKTSIKPQGAIAKVRYYVDASLKEERATAPFDVFHWDTAGLPGGLHILRVEAIDVNGRTGSAEMTLKVAAPLTRPVAPQVMATGEGKQAKPAGTWIAGFVLLLALAGGVVWWFFNKQRQTVADARAPDESKLPDEVLFDDIEDETLLMPDDQDFQAVPPASVKVVKSEYLETGKSFEVAGITLIGRSSDNHICIPDQSVSRKHGEIYFDEGEFRIRDLGSKNGIKVDGKRVLAGGITLSSGAKIQLAPKAILEFHSIALVKEAEFDDKTRRYDV